jgi:ABC-type antimicrobial peptide transport system permease subunit
MTQELSRVQSPIVHVRVHGDVSAARNAYLRVVQSQGQHSIRGGIYSMNEWVAYSLLQQRLLAVVSTAGAGLALLLACLGIFGVLCMHVASRAREIGIRMAIGATPRTIVDAVVRDGLCLAVPGVLIRSVCALAVASLFRSQLYGTAPADPATIVGSAVAFTVTAVVASGLPALRASKVDPVKALREE